MQVALREATSSDSEFLLQLRNDPSVRDGSFDREQVSEQTHRSWFEARLRRRPVHLYVVEAEGARVGMGRLDVAGKTATVSIALLPEARGRGVARATLAALAKIAQDASEADTLVAFVLPGNEASRRLFRAAGYSESWAEPSGRAGEPRVACWRYLLTLRASPSETR